MAIPAATQSSTLHRMTMCAQVLLLPVAELIAILHGHGPTIEEALAGKRLAVGRRGTDGSSGCWLGVGGCDVDLPAYR